MSRSRISTSTSLTGKALTTACKPLHPDWQSNKSETTLSRTIMCSDYIDALLLVTRIVVHAEIMHHHPEILIKSNNALKITLTTHDVNGLTKHDIALASRIDTMIARRQVGYTAL